MVLLPKWLTSGCSAVQIQLLALALHLFIVRMPGTIGKNGLVLSCYYCMKTKGQLSQLQSFCIEHCLHRAISLATDLFPLPEGRVLLVFRTERQVSGGKQNSILAGTGAGWRSWKVSLHKTKRAGAGCSGFPHLAVQGKGVRRKLAQHQSATFFVKYVYSGFFFSAIKLQMPKVPMVLIFSSGQIRYNLF